MERRKIRKIDKQDFSESLRSFFFPRYQEKIRLRIWDSLLNHAFKNYKKNIPAYKRARANVKY